MKDKIKFIRELAENMNENKIDAVKYEDGNFEIQLIKKEKERRPVFYNSGITPGTVPVQDTVSEKPVEVSANSVSINKNEEISGTKVESPMVGTFYIAPSPTSDPFIKEGDNVTEGQTLCIVEAMKLMNEIESEFDGVVTEILVENEDNVEYGQPLFRIQ